MDRMLRRSWATTITLIAVGLTALAVQRAQNTLGDAAIVSGATLLAATAGLYLLSLRKRFTSPRLGRVSIWLQVHLYMGTFASLVFLMHIGWPVRGWFEGLLATCFIIVAGSGMVLGVMNRITPRRLAALAVDHRLELIPALQISVAEEAHRLALASADLGEGATLAEFYQRRLLPFFHHPRPILYRMIPSGNQRRRLLLELSGLDRYLAEKGRASRASLAAMVQAKDDLDYQQALQIRLRMFYALHVALTWSLAVMIAVHVVLVVRFQGLML